MNKSFLKFICDFGPLLIFFTIYYKSGNNLIVAIPPLIIATVIAVALVYFIVPFYKNTSSSSFDWVGFLSISYVLALFKSCLIEVKEMDGLKVMKLYFN